MSEEIKKSFSGEPMKADAKRDIALINQHTIRELRPEEVKCFSVVMCDNDIDRDMERFTDKTLERLMTMFEGRTVISDHNWKSGNQIGRIYHCEVRTTTKKNKAGTALKQLVGRFYILNTEANRDKIDAIEGGILKEVSVDCSIGKRTCSLCGEEMTIDWSSMKMECRNHHILGKTYPGQGLCFLNLDDPGDAYELSFVAVPAQRNAGVTKGRGNHSGLSLEEWARRKQIVEESNGVTIPDAAWEAVILGKAASAEVVATLKAQKQDKEGSSSVVKNMPEEQFDDDCIEYAILPAAKIDTMTYSSGVLAAAFAAKELGIPIAKILYFVPVAKLKKYGVDHSNVTFSNSRTLLGTIDKEATDRVYIRYDLDYHSTKKTVLHECYHLMQHNAGSISPNVDYEAGAYQYGDEAVTRLESMKPDDQRKILFDALSNVKQTF